MDFIYVGICSWGSWDAKDYSIVYVGTHWTSAEEAIKKFQLECLRLYSELEQRGISFSKRS